MWSWHFLPNERETRNPSDHTENLCVLAAAIRMWIHVLLMPRPNLLGCVQFAPRVWTTLGPWEELLSESLIMVCPLEKKADCAPRKFDFNCQIANFPQLFLLSKNQQWLWTADSAFNGTSGVAKPPQNICFCCWIKISSAELKAEWRKAFRIQGRFCLLHNPARRSWSSAGGWIRALLLHAGKAWLPLRGLCQFSGRDPWRGRSGIWGGTGAVRVSPSVGLLNTNPGKAHLDPSLLQTRERQSRVTTGSRVAIGLLSWVDCGERWAPSRHSCRILNSRGAFPSTHPSASASLP